MLEKTGTIRLTEDKINKLEGLLSTFCSQAKTIWAILVSSSGHLLVQRGFVYSFDVLTISALASGVFSSTMELAHIIGEKNFHKFLQEGKAASIFYTTVSDNYLLVSLFDDRTIPGVVKVASDEFSVAAQIVLKGIA